MIDVVVGMAGIQGYISLLHLVGPLLRVFCFFSASMANIEGKFGNLRIS